MRGIKGLGVGGEPTELLMRFILEPPEGPWVAYNTNSHMCASAVVFDEIFQCPMLYDTLAYSSMTLELVQVIPNHVRDTIGTGAVDLAMLAAHPLYEISVSCDLSRQVNMTIDNRSPKCGTKVWN